MRPATSPTLAVPVNDADHVLGPASARVTLVEYSDFECPACGRTYPLVHALLDRFGDSVRFVYRHFPIMDLHPHAVTAAEAAEAAAAQNRFWPMYHLLFEDQEALEPDDLLECALEADLDPERFERQLASHVYLPRVEQFLQSGLRSGVASTPAFFVNGAYVDLALGYEELYQAIEDGVNGRPPP